MEYPPLLPLPIFPLPFGELLMLSILARFDSVSSAESIPSPSFDTHEKKGNVNLYQNTGNKIKEKYKVL
jgi:hypothetical protein